MTDTPKENRERRLLVFCYRYTSTNNKKARSYLDVTDLPNEGEPFPVTELDNRLMCFSGKDLHKLATPGVVYSAEIEAGKNGRTLIHFDTVRYEKRWENDEDVARWRAKELNYEYESKSNKKSKQDKLLEECLLLSEKSSRDFLVQ